MIDANVTPLTTDRVQRFTSILLRELLERDGIQYGAVHTAFGESGIDPLPSARCETHVEIRVQRVNAFADALVAAVLADAIPDDEPPDEARNRTPADPHLSGCHPAADARLVHHEPSRLPFMHGSDRAGYIPPTLYVTGPSSRTRRAIGRAPEARPARTQAEEASCV